MPLSAGTRLGVFEILAPLGKSGMGEVYRATDTKLEREVAVKILPEEMAKRPDRMARFQREAKLLAALDHPHIAAIHGLHEEDGQHFLVIAILAGRALGRLRIGRVRPVRGLRAFLPGPRPEVGDLHRWREHADMVSGWARPLLPIG